MLDEVAVWLTRIVAVLPELIGLWEVAKGEENDHQKLEASLQLIRAMKVRQTREELGDT